MGVLTTGVVPAGKVFGPVPSNLTLSDPALLIGHMTCDNRPDIHTVKIDLTAAGGESRAGEWVPYVQPARDDREQNLEAFLQEGQLHYRATRTIGAGEELLIWYSKDMAAALGVPELMPFHIREGGVFFCPYCMETFRFPNSLRAHMRFKCEHRRQIHPIGLSGLSGLRPPGPIPRDVHERLFPTLGFDYRSAATLDKTPHGAFPSLDKTPHGAFPSLDKTPHGAFPYPGYPNFSLSLPTSAAAAAVAAAAAATTAPMSASSSSSTSGSSSAEPPNAAMLHSPASSTTSSVGLSTSGEKHSPSAYSDRSSADRTGSGSGGGGGENTSWHSGRGSPGKRSLDDEDEDVDVTANNNNNNNNNNKRLASEELLISRGSCSPPNNPPASPLAERPGSTDSQHSGQSSPGGAPSRSPPYTNGHCAGAGGMATSVSSSSKEPLKLDRNQNVHSPGGADRNQRAPSPDGDLSDDENNLSAFRKVEKRAVDVSPPLPGPHPPSDSLYKLPPTSSTLYSPTPIGGLKASVAGQPQKAYGPGSGMPHPSFLPRLALLPGNAGMPPAYLPGGGRYNENLPLSMSDLYRNSINSKFNSAGSGSANIVADMSRSSTTEKLADIHNIENNGLHAKMAFLPASAPSSAAAAAAMSMRMSPFYKSQNPMVEKLLTTPAVPRVAPFSLNLTQNWCAKCNATFRMTSDLVYHMRSHHKEAPMVKKKREDKLKCTVCGETFRERHHLTRHMTSHQ